MVDERVTLLVPSCDRYADLWPTFFALLRRQWPDCPFRVVLGSNHLACTEPGVELNVQYAGPVGGVTEEVLAQHLSGILNKAI